MKHRVCTTLSLLFALSLCLLLFTGCGQLPELPAADQDMETIPWIPAGKGDLPLQFLQINGARGKLTSILFTLQGEDGAEETWEYTPDEGCVQRGPYHWGETSRLTLTTIQPLIRALAGTLTDEQRSTDEFGVTFVVNPTKVAADLGGHLVDLVYSLSSGEITALDGAEYTGADDLGVLSIKVGFGSNIQRRWLVIDK